MITSGMISSAKDNWETPHDLFAELDAKYHFNLDPCSSDRNAKCEMHYTKADDGLSKSWGGCRVFMNPPYGKGIWKWVKKAYDEAQKPETLVCCLLPARTDTKWFHEWCLHGEIHFIRGRLSFSGTGRAPFPSMIVVFGEAAR